MATQKRGGSRAQAGSAARPRTPVPGGKAAQPGPGGRSRTPAPGGKAAQAGSAKGDAAAARPSAARAPAGAANGQASEPSGGSAWRRATGFAAAHKLEFTTLVISVLGLAVSVYLTIEHFTSNSYAGCPANSALNCGKVTTSAQSHVLGIPVAVLGLAFYVFMVAVNSPWGWRARQPLVHWARLGSVIAGIAFVLYLIYAELFLIGAICLYCTAVHVLTFLLFCLLVARAAFTGIKAMPAGAGPAGTGAASRTSAAPRKGTAGIPARTDRRT